MTTRIVAQHERVLALLNRGGWYTASYIDLATGVSPKEMRELCQEHPGSYISSTQGYKRADRATNDEIAECVEDLIGRATSILARVSVLTRRQKYLARPAKRLAA